MKILVGYRLKKGDKDIFKVATEYAKAFNADIEVVTSMRGGEEVELKEFEAVDKKLGEAEDYFVEQGIRVETKLLVRGFSPGEDLVNYSKEVNADMIIMGVRSRSKVGKLIFGSTAQFVILKAQCPVLTVK